MRVLDTNHLSELGYKSAAGARLRERLQSTSADAVTTIITVEEELNGWIARLNQCREGEVQIAVYARLAERVNFLSRWTILQLDMESLSHFRAFENKGFASAHRI